MSVLEKPEYTLPIILTTGGGWAFAGLASAEVVNRAARDGALPKGIILWEARGIIRNHGGLGKMASKGFQPDRDDRLHEVSTKPLILPCGQIFLMENDAWESIREGASYV